MESLREIYADAPELGEYRPALHAFGHGGDPERAPDLADRLDHAAVHRVLGDVTDELSIDLQEVHRQGLQIDERGNPAAEVIERKAAAAALELAHQVARVREARHRSGLGDLEAQGARNRRLADALQDEIDERLLIERGAREIHCHQRQRYAALAPLGEQGDRLSHHPAVDDRHDVVPLGGRYEFARRHEQALIIAQPHRELVEGTATVGAEWHDWLEVQLQAVVLGCARDARDPVHLAVPVRNAVCLVHVDAVAAGVLGGIAGDVRRAHDVGNVLGVGGNRHDANAGTDRQRARSPYEAEVPDRLAHSLGDARRLLERAALEKNPELIAAEACDGVGSPYPR